ncbi:hypothetical protein M9H77_14629 [Catharanthus roseus]|uniref:Uncharacterized protein n=1 Tax=Catharanthus roseus TaxID=4058 RepID=A0ACC0BNR8_CATRO|nr:hypothetical protein M9H77_14629 [Catharanthus roseus]
MAWSEKHTPPWFSLQRPRKLVTDENEMNTNEVEMEFPEDENMVTNAEASNMEGGDQISGHAHIQFPPRWSGEVMIDHQKVNCPRLVRPPEERVAEKEAVESEKSGLYGPQMDDA